ncbi:MAG: protein translocase subunit SecF [Candidatus Margulisbacteria bacterium]|jgi:preprotein translocase subunit SecF|nr:protein translocase subunit SecF [Candidatus Margulisiibacteriota bacterium]
MDFLKFRGVWFVVSLTLVLSALALLLLRGLSFGIDFTGGTSLIVRFDAPVELADLRAALAEEKAQITTIEKDFMIKTTEFSPQREQSFYALLEQFGGCQVLDFEAIGPSVGRELRQQAVLLVVLVLAGMLIYITFRFEFWSGLAAVLSLLQNVLITLGLIALLRLDITTDIIAALLTIVGYSINDTIVVFDRIRENLAASKSGEPLTALVNRSLRSVLQRCVNTSITTVLAILAVYLWGGLSIRNFALTLLAGITIGTFSSLFIAAPLYATFRQWQK